MKVIEPSVKLVTGYEDKPEELVELCGRICYDSQDKIAPGTAQKFCEMLHKNGHTSVFEHANIILEVSWSVEVRLAGMAEAYWRQTGLPSFLRFDPRGGKHRRHFVSGNARAWNKVFNFLNMTVWTSGVPKCVIEALSAYPALFDVQPWKQHQWRLPDAKDFRAAVVMPNQLPAWARERHTTATFFITCDRGISHELVRHRVASFSQQSTRYCKANKSGEIEVVKPSDLSDLDVCYGVLALHNAESIYNDMLKNGMKPQIARCVLPTCLATKLYMTMTLECWHEFFKLRTAPAAHPDMQIIAKRMQAQLFPKEAKL